MKRVSEDYSARELEKKTTVYCILGKLNSTARIIC